ncbi:MAG: tmk 2 [Mycobacterium sp.]|nr:tmk 2 [Mycobacterium sp.]
MVSPADVRRVAVVGIDGCGKSTIISALRTLSEAHPNSFASITCPDFHDTDDAPLQSTSRALKRFSQGCDQIGSAELKALSMYLQMTLYGPVESFVVNTHAPEVLVCERHPLVETFVYGGLYQLLASSAWDGVTAEHAVAKVLADDGDNLFPAVIAWHAAECRRLGVPMTLPQRFAEVASALSADFTTAVEDFGRRYRTTLPDVILWLDTPPAEAARRCAARAAGGARETHETLPLLTILRQEYLTFADLLADTFPHIEFHAISTGDAVELSASVRACVAEGQLFG